MNRKNAQTKIASTFQTIVRLPQTLRQPKQKKVNIVPVSLHRAYLLQVTENQGVEAKMFCLRAVLKNPSLVKRNINQTSKNTVELTKSRNRIRTHT